MGSAWLVWIVAFALSGNPLIALLVVLAFLYGGGSWFSGRLWVPWAPIQRWLRIREGRAHVALTPFDVTARADLARLLVEHGAYDEAKTHALAVIERAPTLAQPHWTLARAYFRLGRLDEGRQHVEIATGIRKDVGYGQPWIDYGDALLGLGRFAEAAVAYESARNVLANGSELWYKLGLCRRAMGESAAAKQAFQMAIDVHDAAPAFRRRIDRAWRWRAAWRLLAG